MKVDKDNALRLQFLSRVVGKECKHLAATDHRLFGVSFTLEDATRLEDDPDLADRVEAFVGRFCRLQDTLGDKLLPTLLTALGERPSSVIDNLDRAERLNLIPSADAWMAMRKLRNQMIHEYVEDPVALHSALPNGHLFISQLITAANTMIGEIERHGWHEENAR